MKFNSSIYLEIDGQNLPQFIKVINFLKENNIDFNIIEDTKNLIIEKEQVSKSEPMASEKYSGEKRQNFGKLGLDVLELLAKGLRYAEIATELQIPIDTVRYYVKKIFNVLEVNNGREAVKIYLTEIKPTL